MIDRHLKLFKSLNNHGVEYLLIGGALAIAYGVPRVTKDIDLFLKPTLENANHLLLALTEFGMGTAGLTTPEDICKNEVTIFKDFMRLDVLTRVKGIDFETTWEKREMLRLDDVNVPALTLEDLIQSKKAAGRKGDLEDIIILEMAQSKHKR